VAKKSFVGLDIGSYYTKVIELEDNKGAILLKNAFKERTPEGIFKHEEIDSDLMYEFIREIFNVHKIKNKTVAIALNSSFVITKTVTLPLVVDDEVEQAVMWEAEQYAPFGMEQVNASYQIMKKDTESNEMTVLIALTKKDIVDSFVKAMKKAKLKLVLIDVDVFALFNAFAKNNYDLKSEHNLLIDAGYNSTKLVFTKDEIPTFSRYVDFSFKSILDSAAETFEKSPEEIANIVENFHSSENETKSAIAAFINDKIVRLYMQIANSISFYHTNVLESEERIQNIVISGAFCAVFDLIKENLPEDILQYNVIAFNPFSALSLEKGSFDLNEITSNSGSLYSISLGLAVRSL